MTTWRNVLDWALIIGMDVMPYPMSLFQTPGFTAVRVLQNATQLDSYKELTSRSFLRYLASEHGETGLARFWFGVIDSDQSLWEVLEQYPNEAKPEDVVHRLLVRLVETGELDTDVRHRAYTVLRRRAGSPSRVIADDPLSSAAEWAWSEIPEQERIDHALFLIAGSLNWNLVKSALKELLHLRALAHCQPKTTLYALHDAVENERRGVDPAPISLTTLSLFPNDVTAIRLAIELFLFHDDVRVSASAIELSDALMHADSISLESAMHELVQTCRRSVLRSTPHRTTPKSIIECLEDLSESVAYEELARRLAHCFPINAIRQEQSRLGVRVTYKRNPVVAAMLERVKS